MHGCHGFSRSPHVTSPRVGICIKIFAVRIRTISALLFICSLLPCPGVARESRQPAASKKLALLRPEDGLSIIAAALDREVIRNAKRDCSHLVHAIYKRAGFDYAYAPSSDLYVGVESFQRVQQPQPGDLAVWRGHVGIVISPSQHVFFSYLRSGPGIDEYDAPYWKQRGPVRFYRYIASDPAQNMAKTSSLYRRRKLKFTPVQSAAL